MVLFLDAHFEQRFTLNLFSLISLFFTIKNSNKFHLYQKITNKSVEFVCNFCVKIVGCNKDTSGLNKYTLRVELLLKFSKGF